MQDDSEITKAYEKEKVKDVFNDKEKPSRTVSQYKTAQSLSLVVGNSGYARNMSGLGFASVGTAFGAIGRASSSKIAELGVAMQLHNLRGRLRAPSNEGTSKQVFQELRVLHRLAFDNGFSDATRTKIMHAHVRYLALYLDGQIPNMPLYLYSELVDIAGFLSFGGYPESLMRRAWDLLLRELCTEGVHQLADALILVGDRGEGTISVLRDLAASMVSGWNYLPSTPPLRHLQDANSVARKISFAFDTYPKFASTTSGFYSLIISLLDRRPLMVHSAFDPAHTHLLWMSYAIPSQFASDRGKLDFACVFQDLSYESHVCPKKPDTPLRIETQCLAKFLATCPSHRSGMYSALKYITDSVTSLTSFDSHIMYTQNPGLRAAELAHASLPFLRFVVPLIRDSREAGSITVQSGVIEAIRELWISDFNTPEHVGSSVTVLTGGRVHPTKRVFLMRVLSCHVLAAFSVHEDLVPELANRITSDETTARWIWEAITFGLHLSVNHKNSLASGCNSLLSLAKYLMNAHGLGPWTHSREERLDNPQYLLWIFHSTGEQYADELLCKFALDALVCQATRPSSQWGNALEVMGTCQASDRDNVKCKLSQVIYHYVELSKNESLKMIYEAAAAKGMFMSGPFDRLVMFLGSAGRRNTTVAWALRESGTWYLTKSLIDGQFDLPEQPPDRATVEWRKRIYDDILNNVLQ